MKFPDDFLFNSLWPSDAVWWQRSVNIGSGNGLLPDGTKPLSEPMLTSHSSVRFRDIHLRGISQEIAQESVITLAACDYFSMSKILSLATSVMRTGHDIMVAITVTTTLTPYHFVQCTAICLKIRLQLLKCIGTQYSNETLLSTEW